ncbi:LuxR family transcriptional regulator [Roseovarius spongiae]|uniref:LuxR family transcriptional regulator n=1 Tax=Roseovarius spongiae TaxID=2320272 RepID=A0A3A8AXR7_9RHOB|nr:autoinducer binding domain-containing protein [Roseovarius spongiae]RKF16109.1 LuxR family transcriptional regulator [Roseovarius spongiae]
MTVAAQARLDAILERLEEATDRDGLQQVTEELRDFLDVRHVVYHWVSAAGEQYGVGTYASEWVERYVAEGYLRIDPVVQGCYQRFHPVDWKRLDWSGKATRNFRNEAIEYGLGNQGYSVPVRGPGGQFAMFTVNDHCDDDAWAQFAEDNRRSLILIAHSFNEKALDFEPDRQPDAAPNLSPRELDALTLIAVGHSRAQVAETLTISEHTLRAYIESARFKLGAVNTVHAVARALSRGLIVI